MSGGFALNIKIHIFILFSNRVDKFMENCQKNATSAYIIFWRYIGYITYRYIAYISPKYVSSALLCIANENNRKSLENLAARGPSSSIYLLKYGAIGIYIIYLSRFQ